MPRARRLEAGIVRVECGIRHLQVSIHYYALPVRRCLIGSFRHFVPLLYRISSLGLTRRLARTGFMGLRATPARNPRVVLMIFVARN